MAAENEIQGYLEQSQAVVSAAYNGLMRDGTVPGLGREAIKDVRNTFNEVFFGKGERGSEPGTPLNPLFHDIVEARKSHGEVGDAREIKNENIRQMGEEPLMNDNQRLPSPSEIADGKASASAHGETQQLSNANQPGQSEISDGQGQQQNQGQQQGQDHGQSRGRGM
jgi:hypothetical protein